MQFSLPKAKLCETGSRNEEANDHDGGFRRFGPGGCIQVKAPDKPIEINLNVKVQQEVVVRLQRDAQDLIQNNPELFPQ